jgi:hypothetical protein
VPAADEHVAPEQDRREHPGPHHRGAVDVLGDQLAQDERALRVADEDESAAVVEVAQVVLEGAAHVPERDRELGR